MADPVMAMLLQALRRGRATTAAGEERFVGGGTQDLTALFQRQGLGGLQPGLAAALARRGGERQTERELTTRAAERGEQTLDIASQLQQAGAISEAGESLSGLERVGTENERRLREAIDRMRARQSQGALLDLLGSVLGIGLKVAL